MNNILEVTGLTKSYNNFSLNNITFSIPGGCIAGFIGNNGAGKTTTLRTILGLAGRTSGNISFFGLDMDKNESQVKNRLGIVLEDGGFYEDLTLGEMKNLVSSAYNSWSEKDYKRYMDMFSLNPAQKTGTLSKGMRMKYALTLALSHKAEMLVMDEPSNGLDHLTTSQLIDTLADYMDNGGKGVLFSTHITSDLDKIADMLIMIDNGNIIFQEDKDTLLDTYRIAKGDTSSLNSQTYGLFLKISKNEFGFTGITKHAEKVKHYIPDAIIERPSVEDIMLANIKGGDNNVI